MPLSSSPTCFAGPLICLKDMFSTPFKTHQSPSVLSTANDSLPRGSLKRAARVQENLRAIAEENRKATNAGVSSDDGDTGAPTTVLAESAHQFPTGGQAFVPTNLANPSNPVRNHGPRLIQALKIDSLPPGHAERVQEKLRVIAEGNRKHGGFYNV